MSKQLDITVQHNPGTGLPANIHNQINSYALAYSGKLVRIRVGSPEASSGAKRYYWGFVLSPIIDSVRATGNDGYTKEMLHEECKVAFLDPTFVTGPDGKERRVYTTKNMDQAKYMWYVESIKNLEWVKRLGTHFETLQEYQDRTQQTFKSWGIE
jgi:hypothetical protein